MVSNSDLIRRILASYDVFFISMRFVFPSFLGVSDRHLVDLV